MTEFNILDAKKLQALSEKVSNESTNEDYDQIIDNTVNYLITDKLCVDEEIIFAMVTHNLLNATKNGDQMAFLDFSNNHQVKLYYSDYDIVKWSFEFLNGPMHLDNHKVINALIETILIRLNSEVNTYFTINPKTHTITHYYGLGEKYRKLVQTELKKRGYEATKSSPTELDVFWMK